MRTSSRDASAAAPDGATAARPAPAEAAPEEQAPPPRRPRPLRAAALRYVAVTAILIALAVLFTWPHVRYFGSSVTGEGGDVLSGIRHLWALEHQGGNPFTTKQDVYLNSPEGYGVYRAANAANFFFVGGVWALGQVFGWFVAFNLYNFAALVLAGTAAFVLLDRLRFGFVPAAFGAYVFAFNPNHLEKAFGHVPLAATAILPIVLLALLRKRAHPSIGRSLVAGALIASAFYFNSYIGLFAVWMAFIFFLVDAVLRRAGTTLYELARSWYFVTVAAVLGLIPLGVAWYSDRGTVSSIASARAEPLVGGYATAQLYLLPSPRHPYLGGPMRDWLQTNLSWEFSMFFGYTTIALALAGIGVALAKWRRQTLGREPAALVVFATALVVTSIWASLPQKVSVVGVELPTLSFFMNQATTLYRVYSRFGVLVGLGLVLLAAYALANVPRRRPYILLAPAAILVVAFELAIGLPKLLPVKQLGTPGSLLELAELGSGSQRVVSVADPPEYLQWLRRQPHGTAVDYPNPGRPPDLWAWRDVFYQYYHRKPLWQTPFPSSEVAAGVREYAADLENETVSGVLAASGIEYVIVHEDRYPLIHEPVPTPDCGFEQAASFPEDGVTIYRVAEAPQVSFVARTAGFHESNRDIWPEDKGFHWMGPEGRIVAYAAEPGDAYIIGTAISLSSSRQLDLVDTRGRTVASWEILQDETAFRFALRLSKGVNRFTLRTTPRDEPRGGSDERRVTIALSDLAFQRIGVTAPARPPRCTS